MTQEQKENLLREVEHLHQRHELAAAVGPDYFDPGRMEYLEQSDGRYDAAAGSLVIRFESRGTRYDGRTEQIEKVHLHDEVIVARRGHYAYLHAHFHAVFKVDVIVERQVRPEVHKLNDLVPAPDTVNTPESLDNANRVPVNIVVDAIIAVLQVLTFRNTVRCNQHVDLVLAVWHKKLLVL